MERVTSFWKRLSTQRKEHGKDAIKKRSVDLYQITEYYGKLWFTFNGLPFCPCDMMKDEPLDALEKLRNGYVELYIHR